MKRPWRRRAFVLPGAFASFLNYQPLDRQLISAFSENRVDLEERSAAVKRGFLRWTLCSAGRVFSLLYSANELVVFEEIWPVFGSLVYLADLILVFFRWSLPSHFRRARVAWTAIFRKRFIEHPARILINVGAGVWHSPGWRILDHRGEWYRSTSSIIDFEHDLAKLQPMPFATGSVDLFYSEHVLEHLPNEVCQRTLQEMHRCLKTGGGLRIVLPDADLLVDRLVAMDHDFFRRLVPDRPYSIVEQFLVLVAHPRSPVDLATFDSALRSLPRDQFLDWCAKPLSYDYKRAGEHINWFNFTKLSRMLKASGFADVSLSSAQLSRFPEIHGPAFDTRPSYSLHVDATT